MNVSIDLYIFDNEKLMRKFINLGAETILLAKILRECGTVSGGKYFLLNNERYDDGNPFYVVCDLINHAFNMEDSINVFLEDYEFGINYGDRYGAMEKLGIILKDDPGDGE